MATIEEIKTAIFAAAKREFGDVSLSELMLAPGYESWETDRETGERFWWDTCSPELKLSEMSELDWRLQVNANKWRIRHGDTVVYLPLREIASVSAG